MFIWTRGGTSSSVLSPQDPLCAPSEVHAAFVANNIMAKVRGKYVFVIKGFVGFFVEGICGLWVLIN